jgi:hypothetical protein
MMMTPTIPTTIKTPVSRGLFWKKEFGTPVLVLISLDDEIGAVAVTTSGASLEVVTEALLVVAIVLSEGLGDREECVVKLLELELELEPSQLKFTMYNQTHDDNEDVEDTVELESVLVWGTDS